MIISREFKITLNILNKILLFFNVFYIKRISFILNLYFLFFEKLHYKNLENMNKNFTIYVYH